MPDDSSRSLISIGEFSRRTRLTVKALRIYHEAGLLRPTETIGIRTEPAHDEAYTTITKAQWEYPAILGAYDAIARSGEGSERPHSRLSCREVYLAEPDSITDDELICDVAYPLA